MSSVGTAGYGKVNGRCLSSCTASKRISGTWGPDDYDVLNGSGGVVGRIFKARAAEPSDWPVKYSCDSLIQVVAAFFPWCAIAARYGRA